MDRIKKQLERKEREKFGKHIEEIEVTEKKPKRIKDIEKYQELLFPCQKVGELANETENWETWACPLADGSITLVQYYYSASFNKKTTAEMTISEEEVKTLLSLIGVWKVKRQKNEE